MIMYRNMLNAGCLSAMHGIILYRLVCLFPVLRRCKAMNIPCQYAGMCKNAKPYCFDTDTFQSNCASRGWFISSKSGWYCPKCLNRDDPETCVDCDPFDPPCSLYKNCEGWY